MKDSELTIVIPAYNRASELRRCLDSIAAQTVAPSQVIVVDDGSTDNTAEVASEHPVKALVIKGEHRGAPAARNLGLAAVKTEWTMFFDSDDIMAPDHVEAALKGVSSDIDIVGWDATFVKIGGKSRVKPFEIQDIAWHNIMHGTMATQRYMARTELFRRAGGWNTGIVMWDDLELGAKLLALSQRIAKVSGNRVSVLQTSQSITGLSWSQNIDKYGDTFDALEKAIGNKHTDWLALKKAILAADITRENPQTGKEMYRSIANRSLPIRFAYHYRKLGLRGAARLVRPFMSK